MKQPCDIEGRLGRIASIGNETVEVWVRNVERMTLHKHRLAFAERPRRGIAQLEPLPIESEPNLKAISVHEVSP